MDAVDLLKTGCQYDLQASPSSADGVSVLHVKLTDAALKAIEEYYEWTRKSKVISLWLMLFGNWTLRLWDTLPTGQFAYWSFHLRDISPTAWTVRLQIAHFCVQNSRNKIRCVLCRLLIRTAI